MNPSEPTLTQIKNGWHCGSRRLNLTVRGETEEEARRLYEQAVRKAAELRARPDPPTGD
jgi:hypothetical protein